MMPDLMVLLIIILIIFASTMTLLLGRAKHLLRCGHQGSPIMILIGEKLICYFHLYI